MKMTTTNKLPKDGCWIFANKRYTCSLDLPHLPSVDAKYECVLKENNIPYRLSTKQSRDYFGRVTTLEFCEYWNSKLFEERSITLPLYVQMPDCSYHYCEKNYSGKVPTTETIDAAEQLESLIKEKIEEYDQLLRKVKEYNFAKQKLNGGAAKLCSSSDTPYECIYDINMSGDHYRILRLRGRIYYSDWVAIFNMNIIEALKKKGKDTIYLDVPKPIAGLIIGRNHSNINAWAEAIGVKEIRVIPK